MGRLVSNYQLNAQFLYSITIYRVRINSFPDYKHLLEENCLDMLELYVAPQKSFSRG